MLEGVIIVKFWLQISHDEQLKRFEDRQNDPLRRWKITDEDWRNRDKATEYLVAAEEMFERTDHHLAPWDVISGEQKRFGRVQVLETAITGSSRAWSDGAWRCLPPTISSPSSTVRRP